MSLTGLSEAQTRANLVGRQLADWLADDHSLDATRPVLTEATVADPHIWHPRQLSVDFARLLLGTTTPDQR